MSAFRPKKAEIAKLEEWDSTWKYTSVAGTGDIRCNIIDNYRNVSWASGVGGNERDSFAAAMKNAATASRPMSDVDRAVGEVQARDEEIKKLRAEIDRLSGKRGKSKKSEPEAEDSDDGAEGGDAPPPPAPKKPSKTAPPAPVA